MKPGKKATFAALAFIALCIAAGYGLNLTIPPRDCDNLAFLSIASKPPAEIWSSQSLCIGVYRPLPHFTIALQRLIHGYTAAPYFAANLAFLFALATVVFFVMIRLGAETFAAAAFSTLFILDARCRFMAITIGERQMTFAAFLGFAAMLLLLKHFKDEGGGVRRPRPTSPSAEKTEETSQTFDKSPGAFAAIAAAALLFAAMLSKEAAFGFIPPLLLLFFYLKTPARNKILFVALTAIAAVVYLYLRASFINPGQGAGEYLSSNGFFFKEFSYGTHHSQGMKAAIYAYNFFAQAAATFFPYVFGDIGEIKLYFLGHPQYILWAGINLLAAALAIYAIKRQPRAAMVLLLLIASNAAAHFLLFRYRNLVPGAAAVYILAAVGARGLTETRAKILRAALAAAVALSIAMSAAMMWRYAAYNSRMNPSKCVLRPDVKPAVVEIIKSKYVR